MTSAFTTMSVNGARVHVLPTDRFKTYAVSVYIGYPLREDTVTKTALIPFVLRRGTASWPETKQFRAKLDDLYGAGFGFDIYKRSGAQIVQLRMDAIHERYVKDDRSLLEETMRYIGEAITRPALADGVFRADYVEAEKDTLKKRIESLINNKIRYAAERCTEEMFRGDAYRLSALGKKEEIDALDPSSLHRHYLQWLSEASIDIFAVGQLDPQDVERLVADHFAWDRKQAAEYPAPQPFRRAGDVNRVEERMDVNQGKLNLGFRTSVTYSDDDYPAALVFNGVFGAFPHSKLFINVREKASLAYYASSRLDGFKGVLTVQSGIAVSNYDKTVDIILRQLDAMRRGEISDLEWNQTKAMIVNQLKETQDSAFDMIAMEFNNVLSGRRRSVRQLIEEVSAVTREQVRKVAGQIELDTIYFLRDMSEGGGADEHDAG